MEVEFIVVNPFQVHGVHNVSRERRNLLLLCRNVLSKIYTSLIRYSFYLETINIYVI